MGDLLLIVSSCFAGIRRSKVPQNFWNVESDWGAAQQEKIFVFQTFFYCFATLA